MQRECWISKKYHLNLFLASFIHFPEMISWHNIKWAKDFISLFYKGVIRQQFKKVSRKFSRAIQSRHQREEITQRKSVKSFSEIRAIKGFYYPILTPILISNLHQKRFVSSLNLIRFLLLKFWIFVFDCNPRLWIEQEHKFEEALEIISFRTSINRFELEDFKETRKFLFPIASMFISLEAKDQAEQIKKMGSQHKSKGISLY